MSIYNSIDWKKVQPLNNNVVVVLEQETEIESSGGIILTQMHKPKNHFRILALPPKIKFALRVNDKILVAKLNASALQKYCLCNKEQTYIIPLSMILAVWWEQEKRLIPIGNKVLIRRIIQTEMDLETKLIKPAFTFEKDQSLDGVVIELGMLENSKTSNNPIPIGSQVQLKEWSVNHAEVNINGHYCLIVKESDLSHIEEKEMTLEFDK